jgi:hypothetical protein
MRLDTLQDVIDALETSVRRFAEIRAEESAAIVYLDNAVDFFRRGLFRQHVDFVDAAFSKNVDARVLLKLDDGLSNLRPNYDAWHPMVKDFYNQILADTTLQNAFTEYNVTVVELQTGADEVTPLKAFTTAESSQF